MKKMGREKYWLDTKQVCIRFLLKTKSGIIKNPPFIQQQSSSAKRQQQPSALVTPTDGKNVSPAQA